MITAKPFELEVPRLGKPKKLTVDGQEVQNINRVTVDVPARGIARLMVEQVYLDGHVIGEAEVQFIRKTIGRLPKPDTTEPPSQEVKDSVRELAHDLLATAKTAEVIGGGTVTLEDGRRAHVLYAITSGKNAARFSETQDDRPGHS